MMKRILVLVYSLCFEIRDMCNITDNGKENLDEDIIDAPEKDYLLHRIVDVDLRHVSSCLCDKNSIPVSQSLFQSLCPKVFVTSAD